LGPSTKSDQEGEWYGVQNAASINVTEAKQCSMRIVGWGVLLIKRQLHDMLVLVLCLALLPLETRPARRFGAEPDANASSSNRRMP